MQIATDDEVREIETLAMSRGVMRWATLLKTINRLRKAEAALSLPVQPVADGDEHFLLAYVSRDTKIIGIEHPTEADWAEVLAAHVALRDRLNVRVEEQEKCPFKPADGTLTTPPVPPTKGPEDDLIAAREAAKSGAGEAARDVIAERRRQIEKEKWTPEHDDVYDKGEMAAAAGLYALAAGAHDRRWIERDTYSNDYFEAALKLWPWDRLRFKPTSRRRDLVKAGALILAEIERLDRASALTPSVQP